MQYPSIRSRLLLLAAVAACAALLGPSAVAEGRPDTALPLTGEFEPVRAIHWLYDGVETEGDAMLWESPDEGSVLVRILATLPFEQHGVDRKFLVAEYTSATENSSGRATPAAIGAATFTRIDQGWRLDARNRHILDLGSDGRAPKPLLVQVGPDRHGLVFYSHGMGQGYIEMAANYVLETDNSLTHALDLYTGSNNAGACDPDGEAGRPCFNFESTLEFVPGDDADYFDLQVTMIGKHDESRQQTVYRFADGSYTKKSP